MAEQASGARIPDDSQVAVELRRAVHTGDTDTVSRLLRDNPGLANATIVGNKGGTATALHMVTDWPGFFPNGPQMVALLAAAGADLNALTTDHTGVPGPGSETPLHWAASSDDAEVAEALIDAGADLDVPGGSIGTPLDNAVGYACWNVARLLVQRGAVVDKAWQASALGLRTRLEQILGDTPAADAVSQAFWHACGAGQRRAAEYLLTRGADLNWEPDYASGTPLDAAVGGGTQQENVLTWLRELGAQSSGKS
jgi:ankyrin repeat protein